jgi:hypothetical protein
VTQASSPAAVRGFPTGRIAACALGALAAVFCAASWKLGYWVRGSPGPGLLPLGTSVLLALCAVGLVRAPAEPEEAGRIGRAPLVAFALLCAYGLALPWGGVVPSSVVFGALWMRLLHQRPLLASLVVSALVTGVGAVLFRVLLKIPLPLWPVFP